MSFAKRLARWQAAGIIDAATAARIAAYERQAARPYLIYALGGLGALTIGIGLISLVAANWDELPRAVKLGTALLMLSGLSGGIYWAKSTGQRWVKETLIVLQYGLTLASIALVGQTYQLGGQVWQALLFWTVVTAPLLWLGESAFVAVTFVAGSYTSLGFALVEWLDDSKIPHAYAEAIALTVIALAPLKNLVLGQWSWLKTVRPAFAGAFWRLGWLSVVLLASGAQLGWYDSIGESDWKGASSGVGMAAPVVVMLGVATAWSLSKLTAWPDSIGLRSAQALLVYAVGSSVLPFWVPHPSIKVMAALGFIVLWALIGFCAFSLGHIRWLNLATAVIAIRIIIGYVELFGSLAMTGFGLIGGGLLTLGLTGLWIRKSKDFRAAAMAQPERRA